MTKKTTLVIPDIHQAIGRANHLLNSLRGKYDSVVFLGDYFDSFRRIFSATETAEWLRSLIEKNENYTFLVGNHDIRYLYINSAYEYSCAGFQPTEAKRVNKILAPYLDRFDFIRVVGDYVLSHAGITKELIGVSFQDCGYEFFPKLNEKIKGKVNTGFVDMFLLAGYDRGGTQPYGGITWCDVQNYKPTEGINQLFGHTQRKDVVYISSDNSENYMIDTDMRTAAFLIESDNKTHIEILKPWKTGAQDPQGKYDYLNSIYLDN